MSNHVHLIVIPHRADAIHLALKYTHGRFATYFNARRATGGHLWQGRYFSCPLDTAHFWAALRYTELNPVRAGLAAVPEEWGWSSAAVHCAANPASDFLDLSLWRQAWNAASWREYLNAGDAGDLEGLRRNTHTGRPLGGAGFVEGLEKTLHRRLKPGKGGRPRKMSGDPKQEVLSFAAGNQ